MEPRYKGQFCNDPLPIVRRSWITRRKQTDRTSRRRAANRMPVFPQLNWRDNPAFDSTQLAHEAPQPALSTKNIGTNAVSRVQPRRSNVSIQEDHIKS